MKVLLAFYSFSGKTKALCERLKTEECDLYEIHEVGKKGAWQAFTGCFKALRSAPSKILPILTDARAYDLIIVASPVWAGNIAPAAIAFIKEAGLEGKNVVVIANAGGEYDASPKVRPILEKAGAKCLNVYNTQNGADVSLAELSE